MRARPHVACERVAPVGERVQWADAHIDDTDCERPIRPRSEGARECNGRRRATRVCWAGYSGWGSGAVRRTSPRTCAVAAADSRRRGRCARDRRPRRSGPRESRPLRQPGAHSHTQARITHAQQRRKQRACRADIIGHGGEESAWFMEHSRVQGMVPWPCSMLLSPGAAPNATAPAAGAAALAPVRRSRDVSAAHIIMVFGAARGRARARGC